MKRLFGRTLFVLAIGASALALTPACAENDESIFVRHVLAPPQTRSQSGFCTYQPDENQTALFHGVLDVELSLNYDAVLLVGGQLIPRGDQANTRAESNRVHINGAVVKVTDPAGATISEFTAIGSGFVHPGQSQNASFGLVNVTLIDAPTATQLKESLPKYLDSRLVIANAKVFGKTLGGVDVESGEFQFPITVCRGCLISFATGDDPLTDGPDCSKELDTTTQFQPPCKFGQDEGVPCQACRERSPICRGIFP
mgnify:CR=1 FL=1